MKEIEYQIFVPGGNDTAFVTKRGFGKAEKKQLNDKIMQQCTNVEQVGFVDKTEEPELEMAGGEFCGNATRSAAYYYLEGKLGTLTIKVNGKDYIQAGVHENGDAWCEIPLYYGKDVITKKEDGIYQVRMQGMVTIVVQEEVSKPYLADKETIKQKAMNFIEKYNLKNEEAVGVMFLEQEEGKTKINPIVWVRDIDTLFYETACGSGTTATAMADSFLTGKNSDLEILQPSGYSICANIQNQDGNITKAVISGKINTDGIVRKL